MGTVANINSTAIAGVSAVDTAAKTGLASMFGQTIPNAPPILRVQQKAGTTADGGTSPFTVTFDAPVTSGNTVIARLSFLDTAGFDAGGDPNMVGGDAPALDQAVTSTVTGADVFIWYKHNISGTGEDGVVFKLDIPARASMHIAEYSGLVDAVPQDTSDSSNAASSALGVVPATLDPTTANNLVVGVGAYVSATNTYSSGPSNSFTRLTPTGGASVFQEEADLIRANDGSAVTSVTTLSGAVAWAGCAMALGGH